MDKGTLATLGILAAAWWYFSGQKTDAEVRAEQAVTALPRMGAVGTNAKRTEPLGPEEVAAISAGKAYVGGDGWLRYTETT